MTLKSTLARTPIALVALAAFVTLVAAGSSAIGCGGGDECDIAAAHVVDCVNSVGSPPSSITSTVAKCNGENACVAACINQQECPALQDAYGAGTSPAAKAFFQCTTACVPQ